MVPLRLNRLPRLAGSACRIAPELGIAPIAEIPGARHAGKMVGKNILETAAIEARALVRRLID
jgi:hypothetical protein